MTEEDKKSKERSAILTGIFAIITVIISGIFLLLNTVLEHNLSIPASTPSAVSTQTQLPMQAETQLPIATPNPPILAPTSFDNNQYSFLQSPFWKVELVIFSFVIVVLFVSFALDKNPNAKRLFPLFLFAWQGALGCSFMSSFLFFNKSAIYYIIPGILGALIGTYTAYRAIISDGKNIG